MVLHLGLVVLGVALVVGIGIGYGNRFYLSAPEFLQLFHDCLAEPAKTGKHNRINRRNHMLHNPANMNTQSGQSVHDEPVYPIAGLIIGSYTDLVTVETGIGIQIADSLNVYFLRYSQQVANGWCLGAQVVSLN